MIINQVLSVTKTASQMRVAPWILVYKSGHLVATDYHRMPMLKCFTRLNAQKLKVDGMGLDL